MIILYLLSFVKLTELLLYTQYFWEWLITEQGKHSFGKIFAAIFWKAKLLYSWNRSQVWSEIPITSF